MGGCDLTWDRGGGDVTSPGTEGGWDVTSPEGVGGCDLTWDRCDLTWDIGGVGGCDLTWDRGGWEDVTSPGTEGGGM